MLDEVRMESMNSVFARLGESQIVAVVMIDDADHAVPLAEALLRGGVSAIELTLRTEAALEGVRRIASEVREVMVGAGTILRPDQVREVYEAGAAFGVSPGTSPKVLAAAREFELPFAPGIATPSDIEVALEYHCSVLKFFPSEGLGGLSYLNNIAAPYRHLGLRYIPLGGVSAENLADYVASPDVLAVGGSWLAPAAVLEARNWDKITELAAQATELLSAASGGD